jgi:hypothetical protein
MVILTKAQREALFKLFKRDFPSWESPTTRRNTVTGQLEKVPSIQWRRFRNRVTPELAGYGAIMVPWANMWIGIEKDGYTHT